MSQRIAAVSQLRLKGQTGEIERPITLKIGYYTAVVMEGHEISGRTRRVMTKPHWRPFRPSEGTGYCPRDRSLCQFFSSRSCHLAPLQLRCGKS